MRELLFFYIVLAAVGIFLVYGLASYLLVNTTHAITKEMNSTLSKFEYSIVSSRIGYKPVLLIKSYSKKPLDVSCIKIKVDNKTVDSDYKIVNGDSDNWFEEKETMIIELKKNIEPGTHNIKVLFCNGQIDDTIVI